MEWHFLRVVDERTNVANSFENTLVCSVHFDVTFVKIRFWSVVAREKSIFDIDYEEVGVARSHFASQCNTVDLFVLIVVTK